MNKTVTFPDCLVDERKRCLSEKCKSDFIYKGSVTETIYGHKCQNWVVDYPTNLTKDYNHLRKKADRKKYHIGNNNYCRNSKGAMEEPYCFDSQVLYASVFTYPCFYTCEEVYPYKGYSKGAPESLKCSS